MAAAKAVTSQLNDAGIDAEVVTTADYPLYLEEIAAGKYDVGFWLVALGPVAVQHLPAPLRRVERLASSSAASSSTCAPGKDGNWMGGPETIEVEGVGKVNPGELAVKLNSAPEAEQKKIIAISPRPRTRTCRSSRCGTTSTPSSSTPRRFTGFPPNNSDALRLTSGVWIQLGMIKRKQHDGHGAQRLPG